MAVSHLNVVTILGSTPIATSAYSQLVASTPIPVSKLVIANSTDADIRLAIGASGSEVDYVAIAAGANAIVDIGLNILPVGSRLAVEAIGTASTKGNFSVSFLP